MGSKDVERNDKDANLDNYERGERQGRCGLIYYNED